jgi:threonine dehydratase
MTIIAQLATLDDIHHARQRLKDGAVATRTPLIACWEAHPDEFAWFKPENLQPIGSFKIRGSYNRIAAICEQRKPEGIIAFSSGNHAQGVAYSAQRFNLPATIVMPNNAPSVKVEATRSYGADIVFYDPAAEDREEVARKVSAGKDWVLVPPFNDPLVIAGQGTIGLEIFEDKPMVDLVLVPIGGGGLISGIATAIKLLKPDAKIIGVEPELAADAQASLRSGQLVKWTAAQTNRTIADGVRTLGLGDITFAHVQRYVDDIITVSEAEIRDATRRLILKAKLVVEPSGALPFAAYLHHRAELPAARHVVMVLSGGNIAPEILAELIAEDPPAR